MNDPVRAVRGAHVGADHVKRAMGQVNNLHDAENQGQTSGHQKQHDSQLESVEQLFDKKQHNFTKSRWAPRERPSYQTGTTSSVQKIEIPGG